MYGISVATAPAKLRLKPEPRSAEMLAEPRCNYRAALLSRLIPSRLIASLLPASRLAYLTSLTSQVTAAKSALLSLISSVSRLVPLNRSQHLLALPIMLDPLRLSAPTPLSPMPLPPTITSRKAVFSNISCEGKHPFQMSPADLQLTLYRFLKQCPTHKCPRYYSPATFTPHAALLPTRWSIISACGLQFVSLHNPWRKGSLSQIRLRLAF
jgi:hypothetical protein